MSSLQGKVALITGGSRGIGAAIAQKLAQDGAAVAITYQKSADHAQQVVQSIRQNGGKAIAIQADARSETDAQNAVQTVTQEFGALDILVNNAGVFIGGNLHDQTDDYQANFSTNVQGLYQTTRAAIPALRDGGRIINIGSFLGQKSLPGLGAYNATKAAVNSLSRTWALELAARNITVNTVSPGSIDTDMNPADEDKNPTAGYQRTLNPFGRYGSADDIAYAVRFLAAPEAGFITAANIPVDGGATA